MPEKKYPRVAHLMAAYREALADVFGEDYAARTEVTFTGGTRLRIKKPDEERPFLVGLDVLPLKIERIRKQHKDPHDPSDVPVEN